MKKELKEFIKKNKLSDDDILKLISKKEEAEEEDIMDESEEDNESESQSDSTEEETDEKEAETKPASKKVKKEGSIIQISQDELAKLVNQQLEKVLKEKKRVPRANQINKDFKANEWGLRTN